MASLGILGSVASCDPALPIGVAQASAQLAGTDTLPPRAWGRPSTSTPESLDPRTTRPSDEALAAVVVDNRLPMAHRLRGLRLLGARVGAGAGLTDDVEAALGAPQHDPAHASSFEWRYQLARARLDARLVDLTALVDDDDAAARLAAVEALRTLQGSTPSNVDVVPVREALLRQLAMDADHVVAARAKRALGPTEAGGRVSQERLREGAR